MSYDIDFNAPLCKECGRHTGFDPEMPNPTYNLTPIFHLALTGEPMPNPEVNEGAVVVLGAETGSPRGLRVLGGKTGAETRVTLAAAWLRLTDPRREHEFRALEPPNKWGTLETAQEVVKCMHEAAEEYPANIWSIR